ncbi:sugar ABC transporter ATP-binding protein [Oceanispirochaeta sp.]|jgi:ribose transport system ATP-binding protein|uniref:sugar ABC transporter ATP-binding protein n=1 Tax=Oceanispirochaeta sp. TaxID=2035350 RepID=UPI002615A998|nr:sugar ABC transporter ATP-binding protein [Oceanispirochaeta sp.]MDA3958252.1 sugar ABC transporter ATP-binding protein [Oceanispirochaeta sp.]
MNDENLTLRVTGLSKSFPGVKALDKAELEIYPGEVHVVMGENGAGKSTLMKILAGVYTADEGEIYLSGELTQINGTLDAIKKGINLIYQELSVAPNLTVAENIFMGSEISRFHLVRRDKMIEKSKVVLARLGATFDPAMLAGDLSIAEQQQIEIARALIHDSKVLIMDEPTAALSDRETEKLFEVVMSLKKQGISIIYISHRLNEVTRIADRVTILRDGKYIGTLNKDEIVSSRVVSMMVGRSLDDFYKHEINTDIRRGTFVVENFSDGKTVKDVSFDVGAGEILGLSGLVGAGRTEMARMIFGVDRKVSGQIYLDGEPVTINNPGDAISQGLGYIPEDRKLQGLFLDMSVGDNIGMNVLSHLAKGGILSKGSNNHFSESSISKLNIKVTSPSVPVQKLSGGNQQKVLLARWLAIKPKVLILDEPTRGVDVGAKSEIYRIIGALATSGVAVIFISSELPEIVGICQRVLVMREGSLIGEISERSEITQENIMSYATGVRAADYSYTKEG